MKQILLILICSLFFVVASNAQTNYEEAMDNGDSLSNNEKYGPAISQYFAAEAFDPLKKKEVKSKVNSVFDKILALKERADKLYYEADTAKKDAVELRKKADSARDKFNQYNLANAPYKYTRLIRDGPKDKIKISNDTFDLKLIAYCDHLDSLRDSIKQYCTKSDVDVYNSLHENLYYDNDLYEKIYYCFESHKSAEYVLDPNGKQDADYFNDDSIRKRNKGFMLSDDSTKIKSNGEYEIPQRAGQKFTSFALSNKSKRIFCATDDNYIVVYDLNNSGKSQPPDSIAMGTTVTAMDFDDNNSIIFFGTVSGDIGFIKYDGDRKNQPVYDIENALGSRITGIDLFEYKKDSFLLAAGLNSNAAVYKIDSNLLTPGNKFLANILPDQELGQIKHAEFDTSLQQVVLETFKANTRTVYLWDPFTDSILLKYKTFIESLPGTNYRDNYKTIWTDTKFY